MALGLTVLLSLPVWWLLGGLEVRSELHVLLEGDQRNLASYRKVRQILSDAQVLVVDVKLPEVFTADGVEVVRRLSEAFAGQAGVTDVKSLTHSYKPERRGLTFEMVPLVPPGTASSEELRALRAWALSHPLIRGLMVSQDSQHTLVMVTYRRALDQAAAQRAFREEVAEILVPFRAAGIGCQVLALPLIEEEVRATLRRDMLLIVPVAVLFLTGVLWLAFRSLTLVAVILVNQLTFLMLLPGLVQLSGHSLTVFSALLLPLLTGVHLTLLAHVFSSLQRAWAEGHLGIAAVEQMLGGVFKACLFAGLTTAVGLLSFLLTDVPQVRQIGLLGACGIALLFFMTFGPGLSLVLIVPARFLGSHRVSRVSLPGDTGWAGPFTDWVGRHRWFILASAVVFVGLSVLGIARLRTDIRAVEFLDPSSPTRQAAESFDRSYGGINVVQIEFDTGQAEGINQPKLLRYIEQVQQYAQARPEVTAVYSYAQLLAMMNQIWEGKEGRFSIPDNLWLIGLFTTALKTKDYPFMTALADDSLRTAYLVIRTRDMPSQRYLDVLADIMAMARRDQPEGITVSAARGIHDILEADLRIVRSQQRTAGFTVLTIGGLLLLLWRSAWLAGCAVLINLLAVALVMAVAGFGGVPLNSITMMVAAVALGIAVDDSVHFVTHWRECRRTGLSASAAVEHTLRVKGRPIVATSAALMAIFGLFCLSSFPPVVHFGLLCALAFSVALFAVLFLLPALLLSRGL